MLSEHSEQVLKELLDIRNLKFHNAQSTMVADYELAKRSIPSEIKGMVEIKPMLNPVVINKVQTCDKKMLEGLVLHNMVREANLH